MHRQQNINQQLENGKIMKKFLYPLFVLLLATGCDNGGNETTFESVTLDFEHLSESIDSKQYGGELLYNGNGYQWYDQATDLGATLPDYWGDKTFFGGGIVISDYAGFAEPVNYELQLSISGYPLSGKNFAVCYVATNDGAPSLEFREGAKIIESLYVHPTAYTNSVVQNGNDFAPAMAENGYIRITATGIGTKGETTGTAEFFLYDGRVSHGWREWNLSKLGAVKRVEFRMYEGTTEGVKRVDSTAEYPTYPSYFAIDDIKVRK
jgi:hypothetical protein